MTRTIQRTPDLGIGIRLRRTVQPVASDAAAAVPAPPPPTPPGGCEVEGVLWAVAPGFYSDGEYSWFEFPWLDGGADVSPADIIIGLPRIDWEQSAYALYGIPAGPAIDGVVWTWEWDDEPSHGEDVRQTGPLLAVTLHPTTHMGGSDYLRTLTAVAHCGGEAVGVLTLRVSLQQF